MSKARRYAILYVFVEKFGAPPEDQWGGFFQDKEGGLVHSLPTMIMKVLGINYNSRTSVVCAMRDMQQCHEAGVDYDP
jgi:hypothetical protein